MAKSISLNEKRTSLPVFFLGGLLKSVRWVIEAFVSALIALFTALFFILVNQKQREYDEWASKSNESQ